MNQTTLNRRRVYYANERGNDYLRPYFNCHGATLFSVGAAHRLKWVDCDIMDEWLDFYTEPIHRPQKPGDVLVVRSEWGGGLEHTAVYLGGGRYFHKRGMSTAEITDLAGVRTIYDGEYSWRRVKKWVTTVLT